VVEHGLAQDHTDAAREGGDGGVLTAEEYQTGAGGGADAAGLARVAAGCILQSGAGQRHHVHARWLGQVMQPHMKAVGQHGLQH